MISTLMEVLSQPTQTLAGLLLPSSLGRIALMLCFAAMLMWMPRMLHVVYMDQKHNQGRWVSKRGFSRFNLFGNLMVLNQNMHRLYDFVGEAAIEHIVEYQEEHGLTYDDPVPNVIISLPVFRLTTVNNPEDLEHILRGNFNNYPKGKMFHDCVSDVLGNGIFAVDGDLWRHQRKTAAHEFTVEKFKQYYLEVFVRHAHSALELIQDHSSERPLDAQDLFARYTLDSIGELGFGVKLGCLENPEPVPFAVAFDAAQAQIYHRLAPGQLTWKVQRALHLGQEARMKRWCRELREFTQNVIDQRRRDLHRDEESVRSGGDILSRFMALKDSEGQPFSDHYLRDVVLNFIIAGRDTTSNALSWTLHLLTEHPDKAERLRQELRGLNEHPSFDAISAKARPYLHAIVAETLRLYPSVPTELKEVVKDDFLPDGTFVPAGSFVMYSPYALGRQTTLWGEDAEEFRPERWLNSEGNFERSSQWKYPVFNGGFRLCLGMDMAMLEIKAMVALLFQRFTPVKEPNQDIRYAVTLTMPMKKGLMMRFKPAQPLTH